VITDTQLIQAQVSQPATPRTKKIPPRAEFLLRHINDTMLASLRNTLAYDVPTMRPPIVYTAFTIVNETSLMDVADYSSDVQFQTRQ
jgi:hypothetical protein